MFVNLCFSGKICSGKSTCAKYAQSLIPNSQVISFADPIYEIADRYWGMQEKDRSLLIFIGESWRKRDPEIWVKILLKKVKELNARGASVIIDDLRMQQEFDALREAGFYTVRLNVSEVEQEKRIRELYPETFQEHLDKRKNSSTECSLDDTDISWDTYIAHDISRHMMTKSVETIINGLNKQKE
jgi:hypothetical protein